MLHLLIISKNIISTFFVKFKKIKKGSCISTFKYEITKKWGGFLHAKHNKSEKIILLSFLKYNPKKF